MKKIIYINFLFWGSLTVAQNSVGINTTIPDNSSVLDINSSNKGILLPRVSLVDVTNITTPINTPATGLLVWNTNALVTGGDGIGYYFYNGTTWQRYHEKSSLDNAYDKGGAGAGRIIIADAGAVKITGTDGFMVTGTHATGTAIDSELTGAGTRLFYNPAKSAFRAGAVDNNQFSTTRVGNFSGAFGYNNSIFGGRNFGANNNNITSNTNANSFGNGNNSFDNAAISIGSSTTSGGNNSFSSGRNTSSTGDNSVSMGFENNSNTLAEVSLGVYSRNKGKFDSSGTLSDSETTHYPTDALFTIGNGTTNLLRHDVLFINKTGEIRINEEYKLPLLDGTNNQVLYTDGNENLAWRNKIVDTNISEIPMYLNNAIYQISNTTYANFGNTTSAINPTDFNTLGQIRIKVIIKYGNSSSPVNLLTRLVDDSGAVIIGTSQFNAPVTTSFGSIVQSNWVNYTNLNSISVHLNGKLDSGTQDIEKVYLLVRSQ